ncbi:hypothetical protein SAMN05444274_10597 [Mariniphaga anaerophila]|uniref:CarboxypepD_reg-like domain-containing protein n=1 Tax=Mariniphaga anaerophila TaxID=1484053 RepID=A0A1M5BDG3_9BACT|nr:carboxypeptidase-like regulatory domain-containing protein [Mariniphaga anaerophila]SHF40478.1 hypothetical protein SAMN05444274_10597 [Mariniphaga anaerophila]
MRSSIFIGLILLLFSGLQSRAQTDLSLVDPILVRLKGRIVSAADSSGIPYVNIVNNRYRGGTITNNDGYFSLDALNIDSLIATSVGYEKKVIYIPHSYMGQEVLTFVMNPVNYAVGEVEVKGESPSLDLGVSTGKPVDIAPELRGNAFNEKPPVLAALFNPVSFLQYYLSDNERRKREVRQAMAIQKNWEMHSKNYNKEMVMKLTGLNEAEADTFMLWFNAKNVLPYTSSEYEVRASIVYYYQMFKQDKNK